MVTSNFLRQQEGGTKLRAETPNESDNNRSSPRPCTRSLQHYKRFPSQRRSKDLYLDHRHRHHPRQMALIGQETALGCKEPVGDTKERRKHNESSEPKYRACTIVLASRIDEHKKIYTISRVRGTGVTHR